MNVEVWRRMRERLAFLVRQAVAAGIVYPHIEK